ncbi:MAG: HEAT repeat domain-containing protein [Deltaproteobacteria bacterium]|nr:MAG: HEAT repeat domain-containing protein [Deltaproteobacteria bacterium]
MKKILVMSVALAMLISGTKGYTAEGDEIKKNIATMISAIEDGNDQIRDRMFIQLRIAGRAAEGPLIDAYEKSRDPEVQSYLLKTLSWVGGDITREKLISVLKNGVVELRRRAASALGTMADKKAVPALMKALEDSDEMVRINAAVSLGLLEDKRAIPALDKALKNSKGEKEKFFIEDNLESLRKR